jgi:ABC-type branched-subunit amino acid transport system ATPase component
MEMVMSLCDHVVVFDRGRPIASGTPAEIQSDERVLQAYLGV